MENARPDADGDLSPAPAPRGAPLSSAYVWDEAEQWLPLWQDVRRMAELRLATRTRRRPLPRRGGGPGPGHTTGNLPASNIIDGQQRLTTLQLLMDATGSVLEEAGARRSGRPARRPDPQPRQLRHRGRNHS